VIGKAYMEGIIGIKGPHETKSSMTLILVTLSPKGLIVCKSLSLFFNVWYLVGTH